MEKNKVGEISLQDIKAYMGKAYINEESVALVEGKT